MYQQSWKAGLSRQTLAEGRPAVPATAGSCALALTGGLSPLMQLVQPQPGGSRYGSACPFCNKVGFHVYYSPTVLSQRKQLQAEEQARVSETQLRSMLVRERGGGRGGSPLLRACS